MVDDRIFLWHETGLEKALKVGEDAGEFDDVSDDILPGYEFDDDDYLSEED